MKKVILIVEDSRDQQVLAKTAAIEAGFGIMLAENLIDAKRLIDAFKGKLSGIITDLHFPEVEGDPKPEKPAGLAVIVYAIQAGLPIAVCSDINNHYARYAREIIDFMALQAVSNKIPFNMSNKDWTSSISNLKTIITEGEKS